MSEIPPYPSAPFTEKEGDPELNRPVAGVFNAQTFDAAIRSHQPTPFSVTDVYNSLNNSVGLAYLSDAEVCDISCDLGSLPADAFLLLRIQVPHPSGTGSSTTLWARAERLPSAQNSSKAYDTIKFSYDGALFRDSRGDDSTIQLRCDGVKVIHAAHLFSLMHQYWPDYRFNNWTFAVVGIGALRHLNPKNDWSEPPSEAWIQAMVSTLALELAGSRMALTNVVTYWFLAHWNIRKQVDLTKPEMWETPAVEAVFNAQTFDAAVRSHQPTPFAVTDVYKVLTDASAGFAYLGEAEVSDISCYLRTRPGTGAFLLLRIRVPHLGDTRGSTTFWARVERLESAQNDSKAYDTIKFSYDDALLRGSRGNDFGMQLRCDGIKVIHVTHLFNLMHQYSPNYQRENFNNWWFAVVGIGTLHHLNPKNDWSEPPSKERIQAVASTLALKPLGSNVVTQKFLGHWNVRKQVDLTRPEMWETSSIYPADTVEAVFNTQVFDAAVQSDQPTPFSVTNVYEALTDSSAGFAYLSEAEVSDISCYLSTRPGTGPFLLLCIRVPYPSGTGSSTLWARAERFPSTQDSLKAYNTIMFSYDGALLRGSRGNDFGMQLRCDGVKVIHAAHLFSLIHQYSPYYHRGNSNNWWFAVVGIGALRHLNPKNDWSQPPSKGQIQAIVSTLALEPVGSNMKLLTNVVTRKFLVHWNIRKQVDLTEPETWGAALAQRGESPTFPATDAVKGKKPESLKESDNTIAQLVFEFAEVDGSGSPRSGGLNPSDTTTPLFPQVDIPLGVYIDKLRHDPDVGDVEDLTHRLEHTNRRGISRGGYSEVYVTYLRDYTTSTLTQVCYKVLLLPMSNMNTSDTTRKVIKRVWREMRVWKDLRHPNIIKFIGFAIESTSHQTTTALVSEWCRRGNVVEYLARNPRVGREKLAVDVARGLLYLHSHDPIIIHADVKPENVLIDDMGHALLCDFGLSRILDGLPSGHTTSEQAGTVRYLAPDLLEAWKPTTESDVYAFACTCIRILFDQIPYHWIENDFQVLVVITQKKAPREWGDNPLERILGSCCHPSSSDRPSMSEVIAGLESHLPK